MTEQLVVGRGEDPIVEAKVGSEVCHLIVDPALHLGVCLDDPGGLVRGRPRRRQARGERLDREPHFGRLLVQPAVVRRLGAPAEDVGIEDVPFGARPNTRPGLGPRLHESLRREHAHRLAQHGAADREIGDELVLRRQRIARLQLAAHDLEADEVHDLSVQTAPRVGESSRHGRRLPHARILDIAVDREDEP